MKRTRIRILSLLLAGCMLLGLASCSGAPASKGSALIPLPKPAAGEQAAPQMIGVAAPAVGEGDFLPPAGNVDQPQSGGKAETPAVPVTSASAVSKAPASSASAEREGSKAEAPVASRAPASSAPAADEAPAVSTAPAVNEAPAATAKGEYREGSVLVKVKESFDASLMGELPYTKAEPLFVGSRWYTVTLADGEKTAAAVQYLTALGSLESVDFDYVMGVTSDGKAQVSDNPDYASQTNLGLHNIPYGWTQNGKHPGGSPDVIVAVIDTGVDYHHLDLRNNVWINEGEIADNGLDDDGNGYVDDVYGWNCVGDNNDPMDDNGHGTHVAGIIAAENNKVGGIGVAYNCKVMVLKAGNSSGYFNNSDIAEAVQYAYMNGASVINMSFGGSFLSLAAEEALENAYTSCILVAAAGNDSACNDLSCPSCDLLGVSYPAALPYVIGVMSTDADGKNVSSFSNYDHKPYNSVEYEVYAVGEAVKSTWPGNKYASLNGTSMAAPTVSGIAALLRSAFSDRELYSTKFIQSQIVNTGSLNPYNALIKGSDTAHSVADVQEALTKLPKPAVNLYDYRIDDGAAIGPNNNGNGVIDAGETVRLYFALHNRGGVAKNVNVTIDTLRNGAFADPYFTFVNPAVGLSDIGTYSVRESGEQYFEILVDKDCPNDYLVEFNLRYTYENGLDEKDTTVYGDDGKQKALFNVSSGYHLPSVITEDTVFTNDRLYVVDNNVVIPAGVTVTFEEGCRIQFYADKDYYNSPLIDVYGTLLLKGSKEAPVSVYPSQRFANFACRMDVRPEGRLECDYVEAVNLISLRERRGVFNHCSLRQDVNTEGMYQLFRYEKGRLASHENQIFASQLKDSYVEVLGYNTSPYANSVDGCYLRISCDGVKLWVGDFTNNILYSEEAPTNYSPSSLHFYNNEEVFQAVNNLFVSSSERPASLLLLDFSYCGTLENNSFSSLYREYADQVIDNYIDAEGNPTVNVHGSCSDGAALWPNVAKVELFNARGESVTTIGKEEIKVRVSFNRAMDTSAPTFVTFGTVAPFGDYKIEGAYVSETLWEGTYTLKAQIENGQNFLKVNKAWAKEDPTQKVLGEYQLYEFTIDTTAAMAMNLFASATEQGIELTWNQDDYDTLMGYNIYRSDSKDGNYVKINPAVLLSTESSFLDDNAEPGKTYWYTFTVVLSDFVESAPAGKVFCTAKDTAAPSLYHTPANQGYAGRNLLISCVASDNLQIAFVTLFYRTVGSEEWKTLAMSKLNDKFSATVFGSDVSAEGLEYYIVASDGVNEVQKGSAEAPYTVTVKDPSTLSRLGDVDGNGAVSTKDALMLMQCLNGQLLLADDAFKRADLNADGVLSAAEALRILQYVNGKVTNLQM